ncbi:MAG: hypothetical protein KF681_16915 [Bdellovibrionaceae bacterium]|nr:hypothetical protein [Pseudobdellovibrionaceae bacterium]
MKMSLFVAMLLSIFCVSAQAEVQHLLFTKMAVFPIADANYASSEDAWWQMRESLTKNQRYLVASRRFMINRGVFQPRRTLKPADVIILGKILDAEALMTTHLRDRSLRMQVYRAEDGSTLWESSVELHPAIPIGDQLIKASQKLVADFVASMPYQGYQVIDESLGKPIFEEGGKTRAWIFHGTNSGLEVGDAVQWVEVSGEAGTAFFNQSVRTQIVAEGKVVSLKGNLAEVQIDKTRAVSDLHDRALIRFPRELAKLQNQMTGDKGSALMSEYLSNEMKDPQELEKGHNPTSTTLAFLGNIALLILLAF